jgi:hypothetical protein
MVTNISEETDVSIFKKHRGRRFLGNAVSYLSVTLLHIPKENNRNTAVRTLISYQKISLRTTQTPFQKRLKYLGTDNYELLYQS